MRFLGVGEEKVQPGAGVGFLHTGLFHEDAGEVGLERFVHHVVHDGARGVERAGLLAGGGPGFLVVGGEEVLEDFAEQFGVKRDFLIDGGVLDDGELVTVQDADQAGDLFLFALGVAIGRGEVGFLFAAEEEAVGNGGALFGIAGESVEVALLAGVVLGAVEALEKAAVEERDVGEVGEGGVRRCAEEGFVAVEVVDIVGGAVFLEAFVLGEAAVGLAFGVLAHALIQRGEEEVLQDGLIVGGTGVVEIGEEGLKVGGVEQFLGDEALFLEEPAEDQAGEQPDQAGGAALLVVRFEVGGKLDLWERPEIPVGQLAVEAFVEQLDVEDLLPRGVERVEVGDGLLLRMDELGQRQRGEDVEVTTVGLGQGDPADQGDFAEHVLALVELVRAPVDDGDGKAALVLEEHHDGHGEEAVDLPGDGGKLATGVVAALQLDGDEHIGFQQTGLHRGIGEEAGFAAKFLIGELEQEIGGFPLGDESLGWIEGIAGAEEIEEGLRRGAGAGDEFVALVAQPGEKLAGGVLEREGLEMGEGGFHGCSSRALSSASCRVSSSSRRSSSRSGR